MTSFLLNPPRKARRSKARGRRRRNSFFGHPRKHRRAAKLGVSRRKRRHGRRRNPAAIYGLNPRRRHRRSRKHGRRRNGPVAVYDLNPKRKRRHGSKRRRNPVAALGGMISRSVDVVPFRVPLGGFLGKVANGIVQGAAAGGVVYVGYVVSEYIVEPIDAKLAKADGTKYLGKWQRPTLYAAAAGVVGSIVALVAPKSKKALWALLAAAGPGLHAFGGAVANLIPQEKAQTGIMARIRGAAVQLSDFIQMSDYIQMGEDEAIESGVSDVEGLEDELVESGVGEEGTELEE